MSIDKPNKLTWLACFVCLLAATFYLYEFFLQFAMSVITKSLMQELHIDALGVGILGACFYITYTPLQLVGGVLYDRYPGRIIISVACVFCAVGAFIFSHSDWIVSACIGRAAIGVGGAFAFTGTVFLVSQWFPERFFAPLVGFIQTIGCVAALVGLTPLAYLAQAFGWRSVLFICALTGFALAALIALIVRNHPSHHVSHSAPKVEHHYLIRLKQVLGFRQNWFIAIYAFLIWAPMLVFPGLWGVHYLEERFHLTMAAATVGNSVIWVGVAVGSPLIGYWSDVVGKRCLPLIASAVVGLFGILLIMYVPSLPRWLLDTALFCFGLSASGQALCFAIARDNNHPRRMGTAIGFTNMAVVAGGIIFEPVVGLILRWHAHGTMHNGFYYYSPSDFNAALLILPICYIINIVISTFFIKETRCQITYKEAA